MALTDLGYKRKLLSKSSVSSPSKETSKVHTRLYRDAINRTVSKEKKL